MTTKSSPFLPFSAVIQFPNLSSSNSYHLNTTRPTMKSHFSRRTYCGFLFFRKKEFVGTFFNPFGRKTKSLTFPFASCWFINIMTWILFCRDRGWKRTENCKGSCLTTWSLLGSRIYGLSTKRKKLENYEKGISIQVKFLSNRNWINNKSTDYLSFLRRLLQL